MEEELEEEDELEAALTVRWTVFAHGGGGGGGAQQSLSLPGGAPCTPSSIMVGFALSQHLSST